MTLLSKVKFLGELVGCAYCLSHWIALFVVLLYGSSFRSGYIIFDYIVMIFSIVCLGSIFRGLMEKY
jgi:hypothetical protein